MVPHDPINVGGTIPLPQDPGHIHHPIPGVGPPFDTPATTVPNLAFDSHALSLSAGADAIRAKARREDGSSIDSPPVLLDVRPAPAVLTLLAMGGTCTDPDANTHFQSLSDAGITRDTDKCAAKGVNPTWLADLTPMASVNCNDPCNTGCMNFLEHLALRIMNTNSLANEFDSINNPGTALCAHRENPVGIRNRIVFGKWRNSGTREPGMLHAAQIQLHHGRLRERRREVTDPHWPAPGRGEICRHGEGSLALA